LQFSAASSKTPPFSSMHSAYRCAKPLRMLSLLAIQFTLPQSLNTWQTDCQPGTISKDANTKKWLHEQIYHQLVIVTKWSGLVFRTIGSKEITELSAKAFSSRPRSFRRGGGVDMRFGHGSKPLPTASTQPPNLQNLLDNLNARMMNSK
jgi:hypothetical protein